MGELANLADYNETFFTKILKKKHLAITPYALAGICKNYMKRAFIFCALAAGLLFLFVCQKDNPKGNSYTPPRTAFFSSNDASLLLSNLVFTDENDNLDGYVSGFGLHEPDKHALPPERRTRIW